MDTARRRLTRGPQWDALGLTDRGEVLLVEAKAHVRIFPHMEELQ